ncbi:MAG: transcription antiterminator [Pelolinea sp.]|jgi:lichenan operon transcriptional antiterminator|nr:transcription antiterminator [Pelolinea sp.]
MNREIQLLNFLVNQGTWVTNTTLANHLDLSSRSISTYIAEINRKYDKLIISSNKGYRIQQKEKAIDIIQAAPLMRMPGNYEERKKYILEKILLSQQCPTIDSLSDRLCISPLTLQNELSRLRTELSELGLHLKIKNNKLSIIGLDRDKRRLILDLINNELENSSFSLEEIQEFFSNVDLKNIKKIVLNVLKENEYFLDDYSLLNYILHIAIFIELNKDANTEVKEHIAHKLNFRDIASPHVYHIIEEIYSELKNVYGGDYTLEDFCEVSLSMMTSAVSNHITKLHIDQLDELVGSEIEELLYEIVRSVRSTYSIDLKEDSFMIRFAFHLKNVLERVEHNINIRNSQFRKIKNDFPLIYVIAVYISNIINKKTNHTLSEDEIAYIALHIGVLMEEKKAYSEKLTCVVLAPDYYTVNRTLFRRINSIFSESLIIQNFLASIDDLSESDDYDLLLSTIEINPKIKTPHILIDPFLSETSINNVFQKIDEVKQLKIKRKMSDQFKYFFRSDLFFYDYPFKTNVDVIETMCDLMMEKNYVDKNYKNEIYEHEEVAPSSYGNIAIPHPLSNDAISSVIAISINPTPIQWGSNKVNIVFMLSLQEENREHFKDIFDFITHFISDKEFFSKIMNAKTYEEFIDILVSFA